MLLMGFGVIILSVMFRHLTSIISEASSWITWCCNIRHVHSLSSPPAGHWILRHANEVTFNLIILD